MGYFAAKRFNDRVGKKGIYHELALNPDVFIRQTDQQVVQTLLHEMVHAWQHKYGKPGARGYHNKEWAQKMIVVGLMPSSTGAVGGNVTGQRMSDYIIPNGPFVRAYAKLKASGWKLRLQSAPRAGQTVTVNYKTKFSCPNCGLNVWGKPDARVDCRDCSVPMVAAV